MAAVSTCSDFGAKENKVSYCFPIYLPGSDGPRCHDLCFMNVELLFHSLLSPSSRGSVAPLRFLLKGWCHEHMIFLLAILISTCASSSPVFLMMYSAYKLNKKGDIVQPEEILFQLLNQSVVSCPI